MRGDFQDAVLDKAGWTGAGELSGATGRRELGKGGQDLRILAPQSASSKNELDPVVVEQQSKIVTVDVAVSVEVTVCECPISSALRL
jgi:hypothetical protein